MYTPCQKVHLLVLSKPHEILVPKPQKSIFEMPLKNGHLLKQIFSFQKKSNGL
ncbi:hypothetical protein IIC_04598 [Bacillus cereus VD021]|uniref:Uncharacterized protein n=1 Tax=Bacillus cereus VD021 TaxID=1053224 RepID=R8HC74_BACCE|nr:hypothetical protein IIC_04598 [Bacillus cereus VD021]